jgi:hypothetical protein
MNNNKQCIACTSLAYDSMPNFKQSDHRPVYGLYDIKINDTLTRYPDVNFIEIKSTLNEDISVIYQVCENVITHQRDWIGIYKV